LVIKKALITGGSGFFGSILERRLVDEKFSVINIDLVKDDFSHEKHTAIQGDIRDQPLLKGVSAHKQTAKMGVIRLLKWLS
jgi:nucleoside-diphosphate-sugar epimerase